MTNRRGATLVALVWLCLLAGCVERKMTIVTEPPGAKVTINGKDVGFTPVNYSFIYYGTYNIRLEKDGFQTRFIQQRVAPPVYEYPPIDFFAENINPFIIYDKRLLEYDLQPLPRPNLDEIIRQADELRQRGKEIPEPSHPPIDQPKKP